MFTPYRNAWRKLVSEAELAPRLSRHHLKRLAPPPKDSRLPGLRQLGFERADLAAAGIRPGEQGARETLDDFLNRIDAYPQQRDYPALEATSGLAIHNRFGTVSIRRLARLALERRTAGADSWLAELIWRDFFFQVLHHHPLAAQEAFRPAFAHIAWPNDAALFQAWRDGITGYPIVDAAMRQINATGNMHNRLRMVAASFLVKDLLVDWRWGEQYFAGKLNDFDQAANNGNWQWAASTGCDAQPYFRIFNPLAQSIKFDADGAFIRRFVPELATVPVKFIHAPWTMPRGEQAACGCVIGRDYPAPVVEPRRAAGTRTGPLQEGFSMKTRLADIAPYLTKDGSEIRELMHPDQHGNRRQSLAEALVPAGKRTLLHRHLTSEELYHITSGEGWLQRSATKR